VIWIFFSSLSAGAKAEMEPKKKNVGIRAGPETTIVEITHQASVDTQLFPVDNAELVYLRYSKAKTRETYDQESDSPSQRT
jgi:hypothetical protein